MIYTTMEPCAYFVCSCLPGTRPLARLVYYKSGLRDLIRSRYRQTKTTPKRLHDRFPIGKPCANHSAKITTGIKGPQGGSQASDSACFIRLEETFKVKSTDRRTSSGEWDDGYAV